MYDVFPDAKDFGCAVLIILLIGVVIGVGVTKCYDKYGSVRIVRTR